MTLNFKEPPNKTNNHPIPLWLASDSALRTIRSTIFYHRTCTRFVSLTLLPTATHEHAHTRAFCRGLDLWCVALSRKVTRHRNSTRRHRRPNAQITIAIAANSPLYANNATPRGESQTRTWNTLAGQAIFPTEGVNRNLPLNHPILEYLFIRSDRPRISRIFIFNPPLSPDVIFLRKETLSETGQIVVLIESKIFNFFESTFTILWILFMKGTAIYIYIVWF